MEQNDQTPKEPPALSKWQFFFGTLLAIGLGLLVTYIVMRFL